MTKSVCIAHAWPVLSVRHLLIAFLAILASLAPQQGLGATQGAQGNSSSASVDMHLVLGTRVRFSGFSDFNFGNWSGGGDVEANDNLCVGRTGVSLFGTGQYRILASGDGEPGNPSAFVLSNGVDTIYYDAYFNDQRGTVGREQLVPGVALTGQTGPGFWMIWNYLFGCLSTNANLTVIIPESELYRGSGNFTGTLSLTLIPE